MNKLYKDRTLDLLSTLPATRVISDRLMRRHHPVFMFHRILPATQPCYDPEMTTTPEVFDAFLGWVAEQYTITPLPVLSRVPPSERSGGKPLCAITFDDGWVDNYEHALPILSKHGAPATVFIATGFTGTTRRLWQDRLWQILVAGKGTFDPQAIAEKLWNHFPWCPRLTAADISVPGLRRLLMSYGSEDANEFVDRLEQMTGNVSLNGSRAFLNWDEIRAMRSQGIDFGCHTHNHALLTALSPDKAYEEIDRSKRELELHLDRKVESFSYPWGKTLPHITQHVAKSGFTCAVTAGAAAGHGVEDPFLMSRIPLSGQVLARKTGVFQPERARLSFAISQLRAKKDHRHDVRTEGPLRLALIIDSIDSWSGGGTEGHILNLIHALDPRYFQPELFFLDVSPVSLKDIPCPVHVIGQGPGHRAVRSVRDLTTALKEFKPHIAQTFFFDATLFGTIAARRAKVPIIIHAERNLGHSLTRLHLFVRKLIRLGVTGFQCNSRTIESVLRLDVAQHRIEILHNHLNTDYFSTADPSTRTRARKELGFAPETPVFVMVGNLRKVKDVSTFIQAAELTRQTIPGARFIVIGEGDLREELQRQIDHLHLQERVQLAGRQQDVRPWLAAADIGILTSISEGSSNSVLEYMAAALPAVLSDIAANLELADGVFFKTGDAVDLSLQLTNLWNSRDKRDALGKEYCERALHYGTTMFRERAQAYYVRLASQHKGALACLQRVN